MSWLDAVGPEHDPWSRQSLRHVTGSALVIHPPSARVLLRWHERYRLWNHVGGHADGGEEDPLVTALREAEEETGLRDLQPWPDAEPVLIETVPVAAAKGEPDHEHVDVCYVLATSAPDALVEEHDDAALRWVSLAEARALTADNPHLTNLLDAVAPLLTR
jgi:8-oxo-dGTP pyrophosphatase MutT (NUDIX family)